MLIKFQFLQAIVFVYGLCGFSLVASLGELVGVYSSESSAVARAIVFVLALVLFYRTITGRIGVLKSNFALLFFSFWIMYFLRLANDTVTSSEVLAREPFDYWVWSIGAVVVPSLALFSITDARFFARIKNYAFGCLLIIAVIVFFEGGNIRIYDGSLVETGRLQYSVINPITIGHIGCSLIVMVISYHMEESTAARKNNLRLAFEVLVEVFAVFAGGYLILTSGARGAWVAFLVITVVLVLFRPNAKFWLSLILAMAVVMSFWNSDLLSLSDSFASLERLNSLISAEDSSVHARQERYSEALNQFLSNPLIGDFVEVRAYKDYPHNLLIESLMALGIFGGLIFSVLLLKALLSAFWLLRNKKDIWLGLIFIQFFVGSMFSGSLWASGPFWIFVVATYVAAKNNRIAVAIDEKITGATPYGWGVSR